MGTLGYDDTPYLPGGQWRVHDANRPQPPIVTPGKQYGDPPSDAIVLFDGTSLDGWLQKEDGGLCRWRLGEGYMEVVPGTGNIISREKFGSCQLHIEFASPEVVKGESQGRGNSGIFLMSLYEIQVLDNYNNPTYADGTVGAIYGQFPPMANAIRPPGEWNAYDIVWEAPQFNGPQLIKPAYVTVFLNNVLLHHRRRLWGVTSHRVLTTYTPHEPEMPLMLQDHGDLVRFRNIWYRPLPELDAEP